MDIILFDGRPSTDFDMIVTEYPVLSRGVRRGDAYQIAGRNGTQVREDGTFDNYTMTYKVGFPEDRGPSVTTAEIAKWLLGSSGYCRLEDSFEPDFYRLARYAGPLNVEQLLDKYGTALLSFDCQPERYLKTGEKAVTLFENVDLANLPDMSTSKKLNNPMNFTSRPLIRLTGRGEIALHIFSYNDLSEQTNLFISFPPESDNTILIDCDDYSVVNGADGIDWSSIVSYSGDLVLFRLVPGENEVEVSSVGTTDPGVVTKLEIIPRWWTV